MTDPNAPRPLERRLFAAATVAAVLAALYATPEADPDLWGHLIYGQHFLTTGGRIDPDPFTYTTAGRRWLAFEFLAQVTLAGAYRLGSHAGLLALKLALGGWAVYSLYRAVRLVSGEALVWAPVVILGAVGVGGWLNFRPQLFTFAFFAFFVLTLFRHLLDRPTRLWLLPLVMPLWTSAHGGFLAGLGAIGLYGLLRAVRSYHRHGGRLDAVRRDLAPLVLTFFACLGATLVNPLGLGVWEYVTSELTYTSNRRYIHEWQPLTFAAASQWWTGGLFVGALALLVLFGVLAQLKARSVHGLPPWVWLASCLPLTVMAFQAVRHQPVWFLWSTPILGLLAQEAWAAWKGTRTWSIAWLALATLAVAPALVTAWLVALDPRPVVYTRVTTLGPNNPTGVAAFLKAHRLEGNLYAPLWWGSYFTWELYPRMKVALDGRNVSLFARDEVTRNLQFYLEPAPDADVPLRDATDFLAVPTQAPVLGALLADPRWVVLYRDDHAALFVRRDGHEDLVRRAHAGDLPPPAVALPDRFPDRFPDWVVRNQEAGGGR